MPIFPDAHLGVEYGKPGINDDRKRNQGVQQNQQEQTNNTACDVDQALDAFIYAAGVRLVNKRT